MKESHLHASDKVHQTRQSTLADFQIDLDTMTSSIPPEVEVESSPAGITSPVQRIRKLST